MTRRRTALGDRRHGGEEAVAGGLRRPPATPTSGQAQPVICGLPTRVKVWL